jgi:hypothetical protein
MQCMCAPYGAQGFVVHISMGTYPMKMCIFSFPNSCNAPGCAGYGPEPFRVPNCTQCGGALTVAARTSGVNIIPAPLNSLGLVGGAGAGGAAPVLPVMAAPAGAIVAPLPFFPPPPTNRHALGHNANAAARVRTAQCVST